MDPTTATYKLRDSLSFHNHRELIDYVNKYSFSINMDKATPNSNKCVFLVLVSYIDEVKGESVVEYYESIERKVVNAENLFVEICNFHVIILYQIFLIVLIICLVKNKA